MGRIKIYKIIKPDKKEIILKAYNKEDAVRKAGFKISDAYYSKKIKIIKLSN